jgi:phage tail sheath protein FI
MSTDFLHGLEVLEINDGSRTISIASSSVIGIIGTAPNADPAAFPLNTPVLVAGSRVDAAKLVALTTSVDNGTLPDAIDSIFDQSKAVLIVVRVAADVDAAVQRANIIGGTDASGNYLGVQAFVGAEHVTGYKPRILIAPGFTHTRTANGVSTLAIDDAGAGYTDGTYTLVASGGGGGTGAVATATVSGGKVTAVALSKYGSGYTALPTFALPAGAGAGTETATFTATTGTVANAVVAEFTGIANSLRAVIIPDAPSTTDADAIAYAGDFDSRRIYLVESQVTKTDSSGNNVTAFTSAHAAGLLAKSDNERGFWWSPSNQAINGVTGTARVIDFVMGDTTCRANLLNAKNVNVVIRQNGFRLWGNRTLSSDQKWAFLCVVRTSDIIADSLMAAHLWAVDQGITKNYVNDVVEGVNSFLRHLTAIGAILGGTCWADPDLNTPDQIAKGDIAFDFDFTPVYPSERVTFREHLVNDYIASIFSSSAS